MVTIVHGVLIRKLLKRGSKNYDFYKFLTRNEMSQKNAKFSLAQKSHKIKLPSSMIKCSR